MTMKRMKRDPMESYPSSSSHPVGEEARARWKHQSLMLDYEDLMKETEAKRMKLHETIKKKLKLQAEVKFLRKKFNTLSKNPTHETQYPLKKQSHRIQSAAVRITRPPKPVSQIELPTKEGRSKKLMETAAPSKSRLLDLNQVSLLSGEEMQEFQMEWEPVEAEKLKRGVIDEEAARSDLKLSIYRDVGSNAKHAGKRKISWQDQVALRV